MKTTPTQELLSTKFNRPRQRPAIVSRPRLIDTLERGRWQKVTLISGSAGSGKSTVLSEWAHQTDVPSAWLSLEAADNEPRRFLAYLVAALHRAVPQVSQDAKPILSSTGEVDLIAVLQSLVIAPLDQLSVSCVLVLDDLHVIDNPRVYQLLEFLIQHMPHGMHLAISSRSEPPLSLANLRVQGQLNEIVTDELRFRAEEAKEFYNKVMDLDLTIEDITAIERYTEGWIAACQLAALRLQKRTEVDVLLASLTRKGQLVADYLLNEVFHQQSPDLQQFMLATSVLQRMSDPLCAALLDLQDTPFALEALERANLFVIPLDDEHKWYRYHHLFAELLRSQLMKQGPEPKKKLHRKASQWFAEQNLMQEAVEHAVHSQDEPWLIELVERFGVVLVLRGELDTLRTWLTAVDASAFDRHTGIALADGWCAAIGSDDIPSVVSKAKRAKRVYQLHGQRIIADWKPFAEYHVESLLAFALLRNREFEAAIAIAERLRMVVPDGGHLLGTLRDFIIGVSRFMLNEHREAARYLERASRINDEGDNHLIAFTAAAYHTIILRIQLRLREAYRVCVRAVEVAKEHGCSLLPAIGSVHIELGVVYLLQSRYREALSELQQGIERHRLIKANPDLTLAFCLIAHTRMQLGDREGANQAMHEAFALSQSYGLPEVTAIFQAHQTLIDLRTGNFAAANKWSDERTTQGDLTWIVQRMIDLVHAIVCISRGNASRVLKTIDSEIDRAQKNETLYLVAWQVLKVVALCEIGEQQEAASVLQAVALLAMPEDFRLFFQLGSIRLRPLLQRIENPEVVAFLSPLLAEKTPAPIQLEHAQPPSNSTEPLSERELQVLELIARGNSNQEIAKKLCVSLSTVKTFVRRIYTKLEVKNRTKAVHIARQKGFLKDR